MEQILQVLLENQVVLVEVQEIHLVQELLVQEILPQYLLLKEMMVDFLMDQQHLELVVEVELDQLALMHQEELEEQVVMV